MAVEASVSRHKKNNVRIYIVVCIVLAIWFGYDGYFNKGFIAKYTVEGKPAATLVFNQWSAPVLAGAAALLGVYFFAIGKRRIVAEEKELVLSRGRRIVYDSIQQINKTHFEAKGFFVITYRTSDGSEADLKLSDRDYDNLSALLDVLVARIS